ncbi:hypothetical protein ACFV3T_16640 [Streptomyces albidoflavus]
MGRSELVEDRPAYRLVARTCSVEQPGRAERGERAPCAGRGEARQPGQAWRVRLVAEDGGRPGEGGGHRTGAVQAGRDRVGERPAGRGPLRQARVRRLLLGEGAQQKGVAAGDAVRVGGRPGRCRGRQGGRFRFRQESQAQPAEVREPRQLGGEVGVLRLGVRGDGGDQQHRRGARVPREERQVPQGVRVRVVDVVHAQHERAPAGVPEQRVAEGAHRLGRVRG